MSWKRTQVLSACLACRARKTKCDGSRPCGPCCERRIECVYTTQENETQRQSEQRRLAEVEQAHSDQAQIIRLLTSETQDNAHQVLQRLRSNEPICSILAAPLLVEQIVNLDELRPRQEFLTFACQSTSTLPQIVFIYKQMRPIGSLISLPHIDCYAPLKDRTCGLKDLTDRTDSTFEGPGSATNDLSTSVATYGILSETKRDPLFRASTSGWTDMCSDFVLGHLISLFLALVNPYWRFVERDFFLASFRHGGVFCSALLVHAIMSCASLLTEIEDVFEYPGDYLTRGAKYHEEALRLVSAESDHASLTNAQALSILALDLYVRGKDKLGMKMLRSAAMMNRRLPDTLPQGGPWPQARNYERARCCNASTIVWMTVSMSLDLLLNSNALDATIDEMPDVRRFLDAASIEPWVGYPIGVQSIPWRSSEVMLQRANVTRLASTLLDLGRRLHTPEMASHCLQDARSLATDLYKWHDDLPADLKYDSRLPMCVLEMHAQYNCIVMLLYEKLFDQLSSPISRSNDFNTSAASVHTYCEETRTAKLQHCYQTVRCLENFRQVYGFKATPSLWCQQAFIAASILLKDARNPVSADVVNATDSGRSSTTRRESQLHLYSRHDSGLEECFRCLIGCATQTVVARGILRMLVQTARESHTRLPLVVEEMLQMLQGMLWRPNDIRHYSSMYPNHAMDVGFDSAEDKRIDALLRTWDNVDNMGSGSVA